MMSRDGSYGSGSGGGGKGGGKGERREGDWDCLKCGLHQFARNTVCRKCQTPKGEGGGGGESAGRLLGGGNVLGSSGGANVSTSASAPATSWETASRMEMVSAVYGSLADPSSSKMRSKQMQRFSIFLGFDGTDAEWEGEYKELCSASGWDPAVGLDPHDFTSFVNDEDSGGHCTDDALRKMLKDLQVPHPGSALDRTSASADQSSAKAPSKRGCDWICPKCKDHQYSRNRHCRRCCERRPHAYRSRSR